MSYKCEADLVTEIWKLQKQNQALISLVDEILNCIPETYLTGYGWDDDLKEIAKLEAIKGGE